MCMYTYIHAHTNTYTCVCVCMCVVCMRVLKCTYISRCMFAVMYYSYYTYIYIYICMLFNAQVHGSVSKGFCRVPF